jgi:REP element-mobilizing transposase RayT
MARPLRIQPAGATFHITSRGNRRQPIFHDNHDRERFLSLLFETVRRYRWTLHSYCLMGNHYHRLLELQTRTRSHPGCNG